MSRRDEYSLVPVTPEYPEPRVEGPCKAFMLLGSAPKSKLRVFGIYDLAGKALPFSDIKSDGLTTFSAKAPSWPLAAQKIQGPVLFAGMANRQFGHVLLNGLGRLWALDHLPLQTQLMYLPRRTKKTAITPYLRPIVRSLGLDHAIRVSNAPVVFDQLYTAPDLFGERYGGLGAPAFYDWLDRRWPPAGSVVRGRWLYITRTRLGPAAGRYACEDHLERLLRAAGYSVFAPETYPLAEQLAAIQSAERLIFAEGSALHLAAMVRRQDQQFAVIKRRAALPSLIERQITQRAGPPVQIIDAIQRTLWPPKRSNHHSVSVLDFDRLFAELVASGMLPAGTSWSCPDAGDVDRSLRAGLSEGETLLDEAGRQRFLQDLRARRRARADQRQALRSEKRQGDM